MPFNSDSHSPVVITELRNINGQSIVVDVTADPRYLPIAQAMNALRNMLLCSTFYRQPYLRLLLELYKNKENRDILDSIRAFPPTDENVLSFFEALWPPIHVRASRGRINPHGRTHQSVKDGVVLDARVVAPLTLQANIHLSTDQLLMIILVTIIRELGNRICLWWTMAHLRTPEHNPLDGESGFQVEPFVVGGELLCFWPALDNPRKVTVDRALENVIDIGFTINGANRVITRSSATEILKTMKSASQHYQPPLFVPLDLPVSDIKYAEKAIISSVNTRTSMPQDILASAVVSSVPRFRGPP